MDDSVTTQYPAYKVGLHAIKKKKTPKNPSKQTDRSLQPNYSFKVVFITELPTSAGSISPPLSAALFFTHGMSSS